MRLKLPRSGYLLGGLEVTVAGHSYHSYLCRDRTGVPLQGVRRDKETRKPVDKEAGVGRWFVGVPHRHRFPSRKWVGPLDFVGVLGGFGNSPFKMEKTEKTVKTVWMCQSAKKAKCAKGAKDERGRLTPEGRGRSGGMLRYKEGSCFYYSTDVRECQLVVVIVVVVR